MIPIITTVLYSVLAAAVIVAMKSETNRRLRSTKPDNCTENTDVSPYPSSGATYLCMMVLIGISAFCGYIVSSHAVSIIAIIELGACYLAALAAAVIDLKIRMIPNLIPLMLIGVRLAIFIYEILYVESALSYLVSSLIGGLLCAFLLIIANKISKGGIGGGDIKLLSGIGFMCGLYVVFSTLMLALVSCIVISLILLILKKRTLKDHLPFGPFIYFGLIVMCLLTLY